MLKMDDLIPISFLNDFIFCPASIYFHQLYGAQEKLTYQRSNQINGTAAHRTVDSSTYTSRKNVLQGLSVCSEQLRLVGKIDLFYQETGVLVERKKKIKTIYDGYMPKMRIRILLLFDVFQKIANRCLNI